jgi:hypothetical protein
VGLFEGATPIGWKFMFLISGLVIGGLIGSNFFPNTNAVRRG